MPVLPVLLVLGALMRTSRSTRFFASVARSGDNATNHEVPGSRNSNDAWPQTRPSSAIPLESESCSAWRQDIADVYEAVLWERAVALRCADLSWMDVAKKISKQAPAN